MNLETEAMIATAGAIGGAMLWELTKAVILSAKEVGSPMSGIWDQESEKPKTDGPGTEIRHDRVICVQRGNIVRATITRIKPEYPPRKYDFSGLYRLNRLVGHYWELDQTSSSFGTIFLQYKERGHYEGGYMRLEQVKITPPKKEPKVDFPNKEAQVVFPRERTEAIWHKLDWYRQDCKAPIGIWILAFGYWFHSWFSGLPNLFKRKVAYRENPYLRGDDQGVETHEAVLSDQAHNHGA